MGSVKSTEPIMSLIEIQEGYIARVSAAHAKITRRTKGDRFGKTRRAARKEAITKLIRRGFDEIGAALAVKDAHDMFLLEVNARD
jgi:hypothetical protein